MPTDLIKKCLKKEGVDKKTIKSILDEEDGDNLKQVMKDNDVKKSIRDKVIKCVKKDKKDKKDGSVSQTVNVYVQGGKASKGGKSGGKGSGGGRSRGGGGGGGGGVPQIQQVQPIQQFKGYASELFDNKEDIHGQLEQREKMRDLLFKMNLGKNNGEDVGAILARNLMNQPKSTAGILPQSTAGIFQSTAGDLPITRPPSNELLGGLWQNTIDEGIAQEGGADVALSNERFFNRPEDILFEDLTSKKQPTPIPSGIFAGFPQANSNGFDKDELAQAMDASFQEDRDKETDPLVTLKPVSGAGYGEPISGVGEPVSGVGQPVSGFGQSEEGEAPPAQAPGATAPVVPKMDYDTWKLKRSVEEDTRVTNLRDKIRTEYFKLHPDQVGDKSIEKSIKKHAGKVGRIIHGNSELDDDFIIKSLVDSAGESLAKKAQKKETKEEKKKKKEEQAEADLAKAEAKKEKGQAKADKDKDKEINKQKAWYRSRAKPVLRKIALELNLIQDDGSKYTKSQLAEIIIKHKYP